MPDETCVDTPGRVNLIGEHTDYHEGYVLPTVIPQRTRVHLARRGDHQVHASSAAIGPAYATYDIGSETPGRGWLDYVQGVTWVLARRGLPVSGFTARIESDIPVGAGVSSSAALTVGLLRGLRDLDTLPLDDVTIAKLAREVETDFVGAPVGIMDQMACSLAVTGHALFLDTRTLDTEQIPIPPEAEIVVIDSGIRHQHAGGDYAKRRQESFAAASRLEVAFLRDASLDGISHAALPPLLERRARHVVSENLRVLDAVEALRRHDLEHLGRLFRASHDSLRDDYEVSVPDVDRLVELASLHAAIYGARMTGGGFGGAVVMIARRGTGVSAAADLADQYERATGRQPAVLVPGARA